MGPQGGWTSHWGRIGNPCLLDGTLARARTVSRPRKARLLPGPGRQSARGFLLVPIIAKPRVLF